MSTFSNYPSQRKAPWGRGCHLGRSGQNAIIFSSKGLFYRVARDETLKKKFVCVLKLSFLGVKKRLGHAQIGLM